MCLLSRWDGKIKWLSMAGERHGGANSTKDTNRACFAKRGNIIVGGKIDMASFVAREGGDEG